MSVSVNKLAFVTFTADYLYNLPFYVSAKHCYEHSSKSAAKSVAFICFKKCRETYWYAVDVMTALLVTSTNNQQHDASPRFIRSRIRL